MPTGLGGGPEPAVVTDALQTFGQDVLQEAPEELRRGEGKSAPLLISALFVFKSNLSVFIAEDALVAQRGS